MGNCLNNTQKVVKNVIKKKSKTNTNDIKMKTKKHSIEMYSIDFVVDDKLDLECLVCLEIKQKSLLTVCCGKVICTDCSKELQGTCPIRCKRVSNQFVPSKTLDNVIECCYVLCDTCEQMFSPWNMNAHRSKCGQNLIKSSILIENLYPELLTYQMVSNNWKCYARKNAIEDHTDGNSSMAYSNPSSEIKFCRTCVLKAQISLNKSEITLERTPFSNPCSPSKPLCCNPSLPNIMPMSPENVPADLPSLVITN